MKKIKYAKIIPNLKINGSPAPYPVVNEREIRAAAGIMFVIGFATFIYTCITKDFRVMSYVVPLFWVDFLLKTVFSADFSIFGFFGFLITKKQAPEYVGAIQKRFAWGIGLLMSSTILVASVILNIRGSLALIICSTCLFFMWLESSCGICVGCKIYGALIKYRIVKQPEHKPACPGGVCSINKFL